MDTAFIAELMTETMRLTVMISLPILLVALVVGLVISILQATTSIQEQTLTFVPKILAIVLAIVIFGSWIAGSMINFTEYIFDLIPGMR
ncbi:MAG: flagellar biosynthesis protein FliQ [Spirochaetales bacterium]|jgi:flagellar biosynthetic protein FliQ|nr:flagellar biosynthesis protein FliQ [Spirochaetales bacterium]MBR6200021.1 flagellar biosynthesis protein FliQ [Spirochaetales bacterium]